MGRRSFFEYYVEPKQYCVSAYARLTLDCALSSPASVSLLKGLKHANIVTLHDIIHTRTSLTLVFEFLVGILQQLAKANTHYHTHTITHRNAFSITSRPALQTGKGSQGVHGRVWLVH
jgi:hypothetical protein